MRKTTTLLLMGVSLLFAAAPALQARTGGEQMHRGKSARQTPPFLIMGKMPHYSKLLMQKWNDPELHLSAKQKEALIKIRKETMAAVMRIKPELAKLEEEIAQKALSGAAPESLKEKVQKVADLKTEATMVHLKCIHETQKVLEKGQLAYLMR